MLINMDRGTPKAAITAASTNTAQTIAASTGNNLHYEVANSKAVDGFSRVLRVMIQVVGNNVLVDFNGGVPTVDGIDGLVLVANDILVLNDFSGIKNLQFVSAATGQAGTLIIIPFY